jgi:hypothetical protein
LPAIFDFRERLLSHSTAVVGHSSAGAPTKDYALLLQVSFLVSCLCGSLKKRGALPIVRGSFRWLPANIVDTTSFLNVSGQVGAILPCADTGLRNSAFLLTRVTSGKLQGDQEGNLRAFTLAPHRYSPTIMDCEGARDCLARRPAIGTKRTIAVPFLGQLLTHSGPTSSSSLQRP